MNGIVNLLKPAGMTSHDAVNAARRLFGQRRIGHAGTLDPGATGVLPLLLGQATRLMPYLLGTKEYRAEMTLGISTDTQDASGATEEVAEKCSISPRLLGEAFASFLGSSTQCPPMTSAVRVDGQRLYERARRGEVVERPGRQIRIYELHIRKVWPEDTPVLGLGSRVLFDVSCSAGTYMRILCADIGARLGCPAHMSFLVRTAAGSFRLTDAVAFEELETAKAHSRLLEYVNPMSTALTHLPVLVVSPAMVDRIAQGQMFAAPGDQAPLAQVHDQQGRLVAIVKPSNDGRWQPIRVFAPTRGGAR